MGLGINGNKTTIGAFLVGVCVVLVGQLILSLITVGGERQRVSGYIDRTEPLDVASTAHRADTQIHVTAVEKTALATIGLELSNIHEELRKINDLLAREGRLKR